MLQIPTVGEYSFGTITEVHVTRKGDELIIDMCITPREIAEFIYFPPHIVETNLLDLMSVKG